MNSISLQVLGEELLLFADRAIFWPSRRMMIIADPHFAKAGHFRKSGIPIPNVLVSKDIQRVNRLMELTSAETLLVLGDLFHSAYNQEVDAVAQWLYHAPFELILVQGNHDIFPKELYSIISIRNVFERLPLGPFMFVHDADDAPGYTVSGHIHPAVVLRGPGKSFMRVDCFLVSENQMLLPAFGSFTGSEIVTPSPGDRVYVLAGDEIVQLPQD